MVRIVYANILKNAIMILFVMPKLMENFIFLKMF